MITNYRVRRLTNKFSKKQSNEAVRIRDLLTTYRTGESFAPVTDYSTWMAQALYISERIYDIEFDPIPTLRGYFHHHAMLTQTDQEFNVRHDLIPVEELPPVTTALLFSMDAAYLTIYRPPNALDAPPAEPDDIPDEYYQLIRYAPFATPTHLDDEYEKTIHLYPGIEAAWYRMGRDVACRFPLDEWYTGACERLPITPSTVASPWRVHRNALVVIEQALGASRLTHMLETTASRRRLYWVGWMTAIWLATLDGRVHCHNRPSHVTYPVYLKALVDVVDELVSGSHRNSIVGNNIDPDITADLPKWFIEVFATEFVIPYNLDYLESTVNHTHDT